jgi:TonB family protein
MRTLDLDGFSGKALVSSDGRGMVQFFATENRLYEFRAYGVPLDDERMTRFFSSVSLKRKDDSIEVFDGPGSFFDLDVGEIYKGPDVDSKVVIHSKPEPIYRDEARIDRARGRVVLRCIFTSRGTVANIFVIKGLPGGLTESAIEAARKIKFTPAVKDGHPVAMWMQLEYNFNF